MAQATATGVLNRLLAIVSRSFPMYLTHARPWAPGSDEQALETLRHIVADQQTLSERIGAAVLDRGGLPRTGEFPTEYTMLNDLSARYIVEEAIRYQRRDIAAIERCVDDLRLSPSARPLAEEALGMAKGHLESLEELVGQLSPTGK